MFVPQPPPPTPFPHLHAHLAPLTFATTADNSTQGFLTEAEFNEDDFEAAEEEEKGGNLWGYDDEEPEEEVRSPVVSDRDLFADPEDEDEDGDADDMFALEDDEK